MTRVIVAEDDPLARRILVRMLKADYTVHAFGDGDAAFRHFVDHGAEIILTDLQMPKMTGLELLARARELRPEVTVLIITGHSSIDGAVSAIKRGAYDYIAKPFDPDDVLLRLQRAVRERTIEAKVRLYEHERALERATHVPLTRDPGMLKVLELARKVGRTHSTVLIQGETGVGKELVARVIHESSPRREHAFVAVNCGAIAGGVLESELFGHEKGAFTGAIGRRIGYFEIAHQGTLLLDEIGTSDQAFQVKLLRVLQDRLIYRVGGTSAVPVDARVIAATNADLDKQAREGAFRSDLYYRLSVVTLRVPPLRDRPGDIRLLAEHFVRKYRSINPAVTGITAEGLSVLEDYSYPGNVRELENIVERAMILEQTERLGAESLLVGSGADRSGSEPVDATTDDEEPLAIDEAEKAHILRVLEKCGGRKLDAARLLGINKTTLWRKMKRYRLDGTDDA
ncbi:MAG: sigma-54-dependent Fis family transcriptional regulator [Deltaproteobacteria bacterium]|nr:sigma-54-dependent Fis family transcriptional regulator [Deltaproteobacteria bacterium]